MSRKKERKTRFSLTLLFSGLAFGVLIVSLVVAIGLFYGLSLLHLFPEQWEGGMQVLLFMAAVSLIVGTGISLLWSSIPLNPINLLINQMNRLAGGDFSARLHFNQRASHIRAFSEVEDSFNTMAEELENTQVLRSDFINNFSHEFKTPIVSIAGFAKLLQRAELDENQRAEYIGAIVEESMRLSYMATNVLNLTKVENHSILTDVTEYNLSEQLRSGVLLLESDWTEKNLELDMEIPEIFVVANEELMKEVWVNLLHNAVKFSPEGGVLRVRIFREPQSLRVAISNAGDISPEDQRRIWQKFYQADKSHSSQGNGVGLAIVKRIVELHRGTAAVSSENGTVTFTVTLPARTR